jgi:hypothetical protein
MTHRPQRTPVCGATHGQPRHDMSRPLIIAEPRVARVSARVRPLTELDSQIRDVQQGPDGTLYVLTDRHDGRIAPVPKKRSVGKSPRPLVTGSASTAGRVHRRRIRPSRRCPLRVCHPHVDPEGTSCVLAQPNVPTILPVLRSMNHIWCSSGRRCTRTGYLLVRNERSIVSRGSSDTAWSRHSHRIISGSIAPPMLWLCTPIPHE